MNKKQIIIISAIVIVGVWWVSGVGSIYLARLIFFGLVTASVLSILFNVRQEYQESIETGNIIQPVQFFFNPVQDNQFADHDFEYSKAPCPQEPAETVRQYKPVLPVINDSLVLVLLGSQGTGKTTLLCHLIDYRQDGKPIIIDPHGFPGKYNGHEITGEGRNYQACDEMMQWLMDEVNRRYQDYYKRDYEKLYVYIDEATLLKKNTGSFQSFMEIMLTESRKVNIRITLCLHSRRAKFLGLQGAMDLAEGIDWLNLKNENGKRWGELETDTENILLSLPGAYHGHGVGVNEHLKKQPETPVYTPNTIHPDTFTPDSYLIDYTTNTGTTPNVNPVTQGVIEMHQTGASISKIAATVFGCKSGPNNKKVKTILTEAGII